MGYPYTRAFIDSGLTYAAYRQGIQAVLAQPAKDEAAEKLRPYIQNNEALMAQYDAVYQVSDSLEAALEAAPATTWLVLTEDRSMGVVRILESNKNTDPSQHRSNKTYCFNAINPLQT